MRRGGPVFGAVTLVLLFCVLCLSVFAVLTLSAAEREHRLTVMAAERAADYYAADREAVAILSALLDGEPVEVETQPRPEGTEAAFSVPVGTQQRLEVRVLIHGEAYTVLRWALVYSGGWEPEETLRLWNGGAA